MSGLVRQVHSVVFILAGRLSGSVDTSGSSREPRLCLRCLSSVVEFYIGRPVVLADQSPFLHQKPETLFPIVACNACRDVLYRHISFWRHCIDRPRLPFERSSTSATSRVSHGPMSDSHERSSPRFSKCPQSGCHLGPNLRWGLILAAVPASRGAVGADRKPHDSATQRGALFLTSGTYRIMGMPWSQYGRNDPNRKTSLNIFGWGDRSQ